MSFPFASTFARPGAVPPAAALATDGTLVAPASRFEARLHTKRADVEQLWIQCETEGRATVYQRLDWIAGICDHLASPAGATPIFVEVIDAVSRQSVMLLPFAVTQRFGIRVLRWLSLDVCDYSAPLLAPGVTFSVKDAAAAWVAVRAVLPKVDLIDIGQIPGDIRGTVNPLALLSNLRLTDLEAFGILMGRDPENLLPSKTRRELGKLQRRLERQGDVRFVAVETEAQFEDVFAAMLEQRTRRFKKLGRFDLLSRPHVIAFYRDLALRSLRGDGPARLFGLSVDGVWIATAYILDHAQAFHGIILTLDDGKWKNCSPGLLIVTRLMAWSQAQGHVYFDLTIGNMPYKKDLGAEGHPLYTLLEAQSPRGMAMMFAMRARSASKAWLQSHPGLFRPLRDLRRALRRLTDRRPVSDALPSTPKG